MPGKNRTAVISLRLGSTVRGLFAGGVALALMLIPLPAIAHGLGGLNNLPAPLPYFLAGVATVLIGAFAALTARWPRPRWQQEAMIRPIKVPRWRWIVALLRVIGVSGLLLAVTAGLIGLPNSVRNPAPVLVWVAFWLVVPFASAFLGDLYRLLNPWRSLAYVFRVGVAEPRRVPGLWGVWPATLTFVGFIWFELVYPNPAHPRHLAIAAVLYTVLLLGTGEWLGRRTAMDQFDAFTTYNRVIAAIAPLDLDPDRGPGWRGWLRSLPQLPEPPGLTAFVVAMIGSVAFHGMASAVWYETAFDGFGKSMAGRTVLLAVTFSVLAAAYWLSCSYAAGSGTSTGMVARRFTHVLVPIAFAYVLAHYFTVVVFEGQLLYSTVSDPFGLGWDLFGTARRPVDFTVLSPVAVWWIQVITIVVGHIAALILAHDRSLQDFEGPAGVRSRYGLLLLVIVFAGAGLTILALG